MQTLTAYITLAILTWVPTLPLERADAWHARAQDIARDIATATLSVTPDRRPFEGDDDGHRTGVLLASIAALETGKSFAPWVGDGRCNDESWRAAHGELAARLGGDAKLCDGGKAYSFWQIHVVGDDPVFGRQLAADRVLAAKVALGHAAASLRKGIRLCGYSGERFPHCPKADARLNLAVRFVEDHAFGGDVLASD
jgi:hypothetical protein